MNVLVAGSRGIADTSFVFEVLQDLPWSVETVIHGDAEGVDTIADQWAEATDIDTEVHRIPEWVWEQFGRKAGPQRNTYMVEQADAVVVVWDGQSPGTKDTMQKADAEGLPLRKVVVDVDDDGQVERVVLDEIKESDQTCLSEFEP